MFQPHTRQFSNSKSRASRPTPFYHAARGPSLHGPGKNGTGKFNHQAFVGGYAAFLWRLGSVKETLFARHPFSFPFPFPRHGDTIAKTLQNNIDAVREAGGMRKKRNRQVFRVMDVAKKSF